MKEVINGFFDALKRGIVMKVDDTSRHHSRPQPFKGGAGRFVQIHVEMGEPPSITLIWRQRLRNTARYHVRKRASQNFEGCMAIVQSPVRFAEKS